MSMPRSLSDEDALYLPEYFRDLSVLRLLGRGRASKVYLVKNPAGKKAALKVTRCTTPHLTNSAIREYAFLQRMSSSPRVLTGYDFRLEISPGGTVTAWLLEEIAHTLSADDPALSAQDRLAVGISVCEALIDCRRKGIAHLDVKQSNVFRGNDGVWKLGDFSHSARVSHLNRLRSPIGSPGYMAPEVFGSRLYSQQSDIYSAGVLIWRLFTGSMPFECDAARPCRGEDDVLPDRALSEPLLNVLRRATAWRPEDRFASFEEFRNSLAALHARDLPRRDAIRAFTRTVPEGNPPSGEGNSVSLTMGNTFSFENRPDSAYWYAEATWTTAGGFD